MLTRGKTFAEVESAFSWRIPEFYNIGLDACDLWADRAPNRLAIIDIDAAGRARNHSFGDLRARSNRLANALRRRGLMKGDRIGVLLPQRVETALAHIAAFKLGAVSIPLFSLFGPEALSHRLADSGARAVITDRAGLEKLRPIREGLPELTRLLCVDGPMEAAEGFHEACAEESEAFAPVQTRSEDPALIIYTSGTTGAPKGALHAHRVLLGHSPGVEISHDFFPQEGDRIWTPADWAWIGGLLDVLLPALRHGVTVVARRFEKFTPEAAFALMREHQVRNAFLPPTALKAMKAASPALAEGLRLRSVASGGETLGAELLDWGRKVLGVTINEFYGQTECNMVVSACAALEPPAPGAMGRAAPGHVVDVLDERTGERRPPGAEGAIAVLSPDPVMFLGYWGKPEATRDKFVEGPEGRWLLTGDRGTRGPDGRLFFLGRDDDVIGSAGYRIGPAEVEDCLLGHPAVRLAGVVGAPDALRGSVVAAYLVLKEGFSPSDDLAAEIADFVKKRLAAHEYPRIVRFLDEMPMTTTGKIIRRRLREMAKEAFLLGG